MRTYISVANSPRRNPIWILLLLSTLLISSQTAIALVGLPPLAANAGYTATQVGVLLGAFPLSVGISSLLSGPASDFLGRRPLILLGLATFATAMGLHWLASEFEILLLLRTLSGLGAGILAGMPSLYISDHFETKNQSRIIGRAASGHALGQALGTPFGILFLDTLDFLQVSTIAGIAAIFLLISLWNALPTTESATPTNTARRTARRYWKVARKALQSSSFRLVLALTFLSFVATSLFYTSTVLWFIKGLKLTPFQIAAIYLFGGLAQFAAMNFGKQKSDLPALYAIIANSFLLNGLIAAAWSLLLGHAWAAFTLCSFAMACVGLRIAPLHVLIANSGDPQSKGLRNSAAQTSKNIARSLGGFTGSVGYSQLPANVLVICAAALLFTCWAIVNGRNRFEKQPSWPYSSDSPQPSKKSGLGTHSARLKMSRKQPI